MNSTISNGIVRKDSPQVAQGNNSPYIVIHTANGTIRKPNPNYVKPKQGIIAKIFGK